MRLATYNVNGVNGRLPVLLEWLEATRPDVVCLQELKAPDERFPAAAIEAAGYGAIWHGQKSWNGVAILARGREPVETSRGLPGDAGDTQGLADRVRGAVETLEGMEGEPPVEGASSVRSLTADKGYHDIVELAQIQEQCGLRTVVGDAQADRRRKDKLEPEALQALNKAARAVRSKSGKALLKARGEHIERGFAHVLDSGGLRRTTLRGREKINKRYLCGIIAFNLCLIMRKLTGWGTPKQTAAAARGFLAWIWDIRDAWGALFTQLALRTAQRFYGPTTLRSISC